MTIYLLEYLYPYERFVFTSEEKAKEHFIQSIFDNCLNESDIKTFIEQTLAERIKSYNIAQFNREFEGIAVLSSFQLIE